MKKKFVNIIITVLISIFIIYLGYAVFKKSYLRLKEVLFDLIKNIKFLFYVIVGKDCPDYFFNISKSSVMKNNFNFPETSSNFNYKLKRYLKLLFNKDNLAKYVNFLFRIFVKFIIIIVCIIPIIFLLYFILRLIYNKENNNIGKDTIFLKAFKFLSKNIFLRIKNIFLNFIEFLKKYNFIKKVWFVIFLFHFNLVSILISIISNYIHIICYFNFKEFYQIFYSFVLDFQMLFNSFSLLFLIVFLLKKFKKYRIKRALSVLRHLEARNCGFINELPIVSLTVGSMGKKKTTIITDMAL